MSVMTIRKTKINTLIKNLATTADEERAIWYGHVANITAYNLQYKENLTPDYDFDKKEWILAEDLVSELKSLMYNIYTNDGNCFLQQKWIDILQTIIDRDKAKTELAEGQILVSSLVK